MRVGETGIIREKIDFYSIIIILFSNKILEIALTRYMIKSRDSTNQITYDRYLIYSEYGGSNGKN